MNIGEANDLNILLGWILGRRAYGAAVAEVDARSAACRLADRACKATLAGYDADRVSAAWAMPIGVCSLCPTRVRAGELVEHIREAHPGVLGDLGTTDGESDVDWSAVVVGAADPTPDDDPTCETEDSEWFCTRRPRHSGPHVAGDGETVRAVWG